MVYDPSSTGDPSSTEHPGSSAPVRGRSRRPWSKPSGRTCRLLYTDVWLPRRPPRRGGHGARYIPCSPLAAGAEHEEHVRTRLTQVLVQRTTPDSRTADLASLLHALKSEHRIVDLKENGLTRKQLETRAMEVTTGDWASEAVCQAIEACWPQ